METRKLLDRDLSWMYFNHRILQEAQRENVPLLERLKFLGIYSNNLDEFFRVRVSTMKRVAEYQGESGSQFKELQKITELNRIYSEEFDATFDLLKERLKEEHIRIIDEQQLTGQQQRYIRMVYQNDLNSATYPLIMTQGSQLSELTDSNI